MKCIFENSEYSHSAEDLNSATYLESTRYIYWLKHVEATSEFQFSTPLRGWAVLDYQVGNISSSAFHRGVRARIQVAVEAGFFTLNFQLL